MLFRDSVKKFLAYLEAKDYAENTIDGYRKVLRQYNRWLEQKYKCMVYLEELDLDDIEEYLLYRKSCCII